jgi:hypothetical protein
MFDVLGDSIINGIIVFIIMVFLMVMTGKKVEDFNSDTTKYYAKITILSVMILQLFTHYTGGDFKYCYKL